MKKCVEFWIILKLIVTSGITGCISISAFASLVVIALGIAGTAIELNFFCSNCRN